MALENWLPEVLQRTDGAAAETDAVLHECRHCGSKFDDSIERCPICDAAEIATYRFPKTRVEE